MISKVIWSGCLVMAMMVTALAQAAGPRVDISLIVTDKANQPLRTLRKDDVHVFEDNVEQTILSLEPDARPAYFGLAIDASGSLRTLHPVVLEAARLIVANRKAGDEFFIESFVSSEKIARVQDFTGDINTLTQALTTIKVYGGQSAVLDGIYNAAAYVAEHEKTNPGRRKVLVVITDGEDRNSRMHLDETLKSLRVEDVQVFVIGLVTDLDTDAGIGAKSPRAKAEKLLRTIAAESGGLAFFPKNDKELINAADQISNAVAAQYRLTYQSSREPAKTEFRKVEIKPGATSGEKRNAIAPSGYYVEAKKTLTKTGVKSP